MTKQQQGDVSLFQTNDEGDISVENGLVEMTGGLEVAAYLSLFGGNEDDDGSKDSDANWWGNLDETDPALMYRSETQNLLQGIPSTSSNLLKVEDAAKRDLKWFITNKIASTVDVFASIPGVNKIKLLIKIEAQGLENEFEFVENWKVAT